MLKQFSKISYTIIAVLGLLIGGCNSTAENHTQWTEIRPGLKYTHIEFDHNSIKKELIYISIDPKKFKFRIFENKKGQKVKSLKEIQDETKALVTFNGTFFDTDFKAIGLLINQSQKLHSLSSSQLLNGIFEVTKNGQAMLISSKNFAPNDTIDFAIQNGPILINEKGEIMFQKETGKTANRTLIGKDKDENVVLIILKQNFFQSNNTMTLYEMAHFLKTAPEMKDFGLNSVLNLDGGPSTGAVINNENFAETNPVENAVTISDIITP